MMTMNAQEIFNKLETIRYWHHTDDPQDVYNQLQTLIDKNTQDTKFYRDKLKEYDEICQQGANLSNSNHAFNQVFNELSGITNSQQQQQKRKFKQQLRHLSLAYKRQWAAHQAYDTLLEAFYNQSNFNHKQTFRQQAESAQILDHFYQGQANQSLYTQLRPYTRLMHLVENNGDADEHAHKLATVFNSEKDVFNYLRWFQQQYPNRHPMHDACLFTLPETFAQQSTWQQLAARYYSDMAFWKLLPHAPQIEDAIKSLKKPDQTQPTSQQLQNARNDVQKLRQACKQLTKNRGQQTPEQRETNDSHLADRKRALTQAQRELANLAANRELSRLTLEDLRAIQQIQTLDASPTFRLFIDHAIPDHKYREFINLERHDDNHQIPRVTIKGDTLGGYYQRYYLQKLEVKDEQQAARAAVLGKLTDCCQSLSGEAGEPCVKHGLTSKNGGFYVLFKGDPENPDPTQDQVVAQSWAWRSQTGALVLDSIETAHKQDNSMSQVIACFYQELGRRLVDQAYTHKVACGRMQSIQQRDRSAFITFMGNPIERFVDYQGYNDSRQQAVIYEQDKPYYWYHTDDQHRQKTLKLLDAIMSDHQTPLGQSAPLYNMISYALATDNSSLFQAIKTQADQAKRSEAYETLRDNTHSYWNGQLSSASVIQAIENGQLFVNARNRPGARPLMALCKSDEPDHVNMKRLIRALSAQQLGQHIENGTNLIRLLALFSHDPQEQTAILDQLSQTGQLNSIIQYERHLVEVLEELKTADQKTTLLNQCQNRH